MLGQQGGPGKMIKDDAINSEMKGREEGKQVQGRPRKGAKRHARESKGKERKRKGSWKEGKGFECKAKEKNEPLLR